MRHHCSALTCVLTVAGLATTWALAQPPADKAKAPAPKPTAAQPAGQPPMTPEMQKMMEAYMKAATPGKEQAVLTKGVGTWECKCKSWPGPDQTPQEWTATTVISSMMDGRFTHAEVKGDVPGMGPFHGAGVYGYDNVAKQYQSTWLDSMGTGMMVGTGTLSADGKTMTWTYNFTCPITCKPAVMREVEHFTSDNETKMEMFGPDPVSGKEYKMMEMTSTRKGGAPAKAATPTKAPAPTTGGK